MCGMKLLSHSQTSAAPLKFGNGLVISSHNLLDMWLQIHAGLSWSMLVKGAPDVQHISNGVISVLLWATDIITTNGGHILNLNNELKKSPAQTDLCAGILEGLWQS